MFAKSFADRYHGSIKKLAPAEKKHRAALDALDAALQAHQAAKVPGLRRAAGESEQQLADTLEAAALAHRQYWQSRRDALLPDIERFARLAHEFNRLAVLCGDRSANPVVQQLQAAMIPGAGEIDVETGDGVPPEPPDCELLEDYRGAWKT